MTHDEGLRETYAGVWQGLHASEEIIARHGEEYAAWKRGEPVRRGGGELETEVADRAAPVVLRHAEKLPEDGTLVVVSHGGTMHAPPSAASSPWTRPATGRASADSDQLLLVRPRPGRPRLAPAGAQRRHPARAGARRRRLRPRRDPDFTSRQVAG
ncbi:hypothetical protein SFUMM280S_01868 [Streptomyces fumanus]